jgi:hypothetical protein
MSGGGDMWVYVLMVESKMKPIRSDKVLANVSDRIHFLIPGIKKMWDWILVIQSRGIGLD